jgi:hypothetical protein
MRRQICQRRQPRLEQFGARLCEVGVPDIQGRGSLTRRLTVSEPTAEGFEQRVALPQHPLVIPAYASQPRPARHDQVIDEAPAFAGIALDDCDVYGREHHGAQYSYDFASGAQWCTVELGAVGLAGIEFELEGQLPRIVEPGVHPGSHYGAGSA